MKIWKTAVACLTGLCLLLPAVSCGGGAKAALVNCGVTAVEFEKPAAVEDPVYYSSLTTDDASENGVIVCPYYSLTVGGTTVPVYSTRCAKNLHSFAYVTI